MSGVLDVIQTEILQRTRRNKRMHCHESVGKIGPKSHQAGDYNIIETRVVVILATFYASLLR